MLENLKENARKKIGWKNRMKENKMKENKIKLNSTIIFLLTSLNQFIYF